MSGVQLEQLVQAGSHVTTWRLTLPGGMQIDRFVSDREMVDDSDSFWMDLQAAGRRLAHLEALAQEVVGPPAFGIPRGLLCPELVEEATRARQAIVVGLFPFDVVAAALEALA